MASALSNHVLFLSSRPRSRSRSTLSSPKSLSAANTLLRLPVHQNPRPKPLSASHLFRGPFRASLRDAAAAGIKTVSGDEDNQVPANQPENNVEHEDLPSMKELLLAYKKALMESDEKRISEIEAQICVMEKQKNSFSVKFGDINTDIATKRDKFLRLKADFDNYRKRIEKDRLSLTSDVQGDVIGSFLPVIDSFERAKQLLNPETERERKIDTSYQGIYKQFVEIMRSLRVSVVGTVGKPFDPSIHEAVAREESHKFTEGIVMEEVRRGFVLGDRVLRPATVKVSTGPGPGKAPAAGGSLKRSASAADLAEDTAATSTSTN